MDTITSSSPEFKQAESTLMFIDMNSCFCSVEQQKNPRLRGKPIAVGAYLSDSACIISPSIEAKQRGVETGMRISEGKALCPELQILMPDPPAYRFVNRKFLQIFQYYTDAIATISIDEFALDFTHTPSLAGYKKKNIDVDDAMKFIAQEIKHRITKEFDWMRVSIGISTNRFLAKMASNLQKPDGLNVINEKNVLSVLSNMDLEDIKGIKRGNGGRLRQYGITTPLEFYKASQVDLMQAFHSVIGFHWWMRLHGYEPDDREFDRKSFGNSHALYVPYDTKSSELHKILMQLCLKTGYRLRRDGYSAQGIHVGCLFSDHSYWHKGSKTKKQLLGDAEIYKEALQLLSVAPTKGVRNLSISCHYLIKGQAVQESLFENNDKRISIVKTLDAISNRWGVNSVVPASLLNLKRKVMDRVPFGGVKELQEFMYQDPITTELL